MKGNPAVPGGPLTSKPTWSNTSGCSTTSAFCLLAVVRGRPQATREERRWTSPIQRWRSRSPRRPALSSSRRTGHVPKSVTVVLSESTLVITLHGALSPAEKALAKSPAGAAQVQEFHRQLFANCLRLAAAGDQEDHRGGGARGDRGSRADDRHRGAGVHDRHHGAGVPARPCEVPAGSWRRKRLGESSQNTERCDVSSIKKPRVGCDRRV